MLFLQLLLRWVHTLLQRSFRQWRARLLGRVMLQICCIWRHSVPLDKRHDDEQAWLNAIVCTISLSTANFFKLDNIKKHRPSETCEMCPARYMVQKTFHRLHSFHKVWWACGAIGEALDFISMFHQLLIPLT